MAGTDATVSLCMDYVLFKKVRNIPLHLLLSYNRFGFHAKIKINFVTVYTDLMRYKFARTPLAT